MYGDYLLNDGEKAPLTGNTFQQVGAMFCESDPRADN